MNMPTDSVMSQESTILQEDSKHDSTKANKTAGKDRPAQLEANDSAITRKNESVLSNVKNVLAAQKASEEAGIPASGGTLVYIDGAESLITFAQRELESGRHSSEASKVMADSINAMAGTDLVRTDVGPNGKVLVLTKNEIKLPNGDIYNGEMLGNLRFGRGTYYYTNGDVYVGEWADGLFHGYGVLRKSRFRENGKECINRSYQGHWAKGLRHGKGRYESGTGDIYEGEFEYDAFHGTGTMIYADGDRYEGTWLKGQRSGRGTMCYANGDVYSGEWQRGIFHGYGTYKWKFGGAYVGGYVNGLREGVGKRTYTSGAEYEGEFKADCMCGRGIYKSSIGDLYIGSMENNKYHGEGTLMLVNGDRYQGTFFNGNFCGIGRYEYAGGGYYEGEYAAMMRTGISYKVRERWYWDAWNADPSVQRRKMVELLGEDGKKWKQLQRANRRKLKFKIADASKEHLRLSERDKTRLRKMLGDDMSVASLDESSTDSSGEEEFEGNEIPPSKRLVQAEAEKYRREREKNRDLERFESNLVNLPHAVRQRAIAAFKKKREKTAAEFTAPIIVGSQQDKDFVKAGGRTDGTVIPLADGKRHGQGVRIWADGSKYEGEWISDKMEGFGVYVGAGSLGVRYEGMWVAGKREGRGVESYGNNDGLEYTCPLGNTHLGTARCFYDGNFSNNRFHGFGTFTCCDGRQYSGNWQGGKRHGMGKWVMLPVHLQYNISRDEFGRVVVTPPEGYHPFAPKMDDAYCVRVYEGTFKKNRRTGVGRVTLNNGDVYEGEFLKGKPHGVIRITFNTKKVTFALYDNGTREGWLRGSKLIDLEEKWRKEAEDLRPLTLQNREGADSPTTDSVIKSSGTTRKNLSKAKQLAKDIEEQMSMKQIDIQKDGANLVDDKPTEKLDESSRQIDSGFFNVFSKTTMVGRI